MVKELLTKNESFKSKKIPRILLVGAGIFLLAGCSLPLQSSNYPAWKTKNLIMNEDSNSGFMGLYVGDTAHVTDFDISVSSYEEKDDKLNITVKIKNITDSKKNISNKDFPLMWNLDKDKSSYTYPLDDNKKYTVDANEEIEINIAYELKSNMKKPLAVYYGEVYEDKTDGNSYYFYIK